MVSLLVDGGFADSVGCYVLGLRGAAMLEVDVPLIFGLVYVVGDALLFNCA